MTERRKKASELASALVSVMHHSPEVELRQYRELADEAGETLVVTLAENEELRARAEASEQRESAALEHLNRIIALAPALPKSFQWTGTERAEDLFDAELRHANGKKPIDYLRAWLGMFRPFAYATRDDSWGELEKLIAITMNNVVKTLAAIKQAEVALSTTKGGEASQ